MNTQTSQAVLQHVGIRRPRPGFPGECVFAEMWEACMSQAGEENWQGDRRVPIDDVLRDFAGSVDQRLASVVAGTATWLGTNCGRAMLHEATKLRDAPGCTKGHEYLMAWASENARQRGLNGGIRTIESIVATEVELTGATASLPEVTFRDLEAVECLMLWMASRKGQRFLSDALGEVEVRAAALRRKEAVEWAARLAAAG